MQKLRDDLHSVSTADYARDKQKLQQQSNDTARRLLTKLCCSPHLTPKNKVEDDFNCCICMNVVREPRECSNCEKLFCNQCIEQWK